jgi:hypothetical protein
MTNDELKAYLIGFDPMDEWYFDRATEAVSEGMQTAAHAFQQIGHSAMQMTGAITRWTEEAE